MRVYVAASEAQLARLVEGPVVFAVGHAVTDEVRAELTGSDDEELEYVVMGMAASDAIALATGRPRRVVLAVDTEATPTGALSEVSLRDPVDLVQVAAVHVDAPDAEGDVAAALAAPHDQDLAERALRHDLGWYGVQEIEEILGPDSGAEA